MTKRDEAEAKNILTYEPRRPCKWCKTMERNTTSGKCTKCTNLNIESRKDIARLKRTRRTAAQIEHALRISEKNRQRGLDAIEKQVQAARRTPWREALSGVVKGEQIREPVYYGGENCYPDIIPYTATHQVARASARFFIRAEDRTAW